MFNKPIHYIPFIHICIVFTGDVVLPQLLEWINFHFPSREIAAQKILSQKTIGADLQDSTYWEVVMGCAFHGKLNLVCRLLALHSKADHSAFITADNIIRTMPVYNVYGGYSVNEFTMRWKHWQMDLSSNLEANCFVIDNNLETLMKVGKAILMRNFFFIENLFIFVI